MMRQRNQRTARLAPPAPDAARGRGLHRSHLIPAPILGPALHRFHLIPAPILGPALHRFHLIPAPILGPALHRLRPIPAPILALAFRRFLLIAALLVGPALASVSFPTGAVAQDIAFGKNKVQYADFQWRVLRSEHFRVYFYREEAGLAEQALTMAEAAYLQIRPRFALDVTHPIPLILYSSHQDFEQTNITPYFLPEGVAGLTEFAKGRVLIPFDGSLSSLRTTIQHELVHVFQMAEDDEVQRQHYQQAPVEPPAWFEEGQAVHWSEKRDAEADMVLRDMVLSGKLPSIGEFWRYEGGYATYKLGQSVLDYVGDNYGEDRIRLLNDRLWAGRSFDDVIRDVLGVPVKDLSERWTFALDRRYYPEVNQAQPAAISSAALTRAGGADFKPLPLPAGLKGYPHHFVFLSPRNGFTNIYTASMDGEPETDVETLVEGERRSGFESFHEFQSRMDVSAGGLLLFVSKHEGSDEVVIFSIEDRRVVERHGFRNLVGLSSPGWAGNEDRFIFSGLSKDGYSDLYLFDRRTDRLTRLTDDRYQDLDPSYCSWLDSVVFSSDRTAFGRGGSKNLFLLDLRTRDLRYLTRGRWNDTNPVCDPESRGIYFVSDRSGFYEVYWIDETGSGHRLTRVLEGMFDPRPVPGQHRFLATVYREGGFQVRSFAVTDTSGPRISLAPADSTAPWDTREVAPPVAAAVSRYRAHYTLDVAQGGVGFDPNLQTGEGVEAAFSDIMGNHLIYLGLGNTEFTTEDFLRNFSVGATYLNLTHRMNYGLSVFHYAGDFYDELGNPYYESRAGVGVVLRYPLSKFERVETDLSVAYKETDRPFTGFQRDAPVGAHSVSYIRDTSLWDANGPLDGHRLNLTAGVTLDLNTGAAENTLLLADWRRYVRLGLLSAYALRLQGLWSEGDDPEIFTLGGSLSLRSYPRDYFWGKRTVLVNQEVRFPLLRGLAMGLPFGNLELPGVQGAVFIDAGSAWNNGWPAQSDLHGSYGVGFRMGLGGLAVLRLDVGRETDFHTLPSHTLTEFYIGWDY